MKTFENVLQAIGRTPLIRLNRLLHLRQDSAARQLEGEWRLKLLSKAIYSTFCDCVELGVAEDARTLFERAKASK